MPFLEECATHRSEAPRVSRPEAVGLARTKGTHKKNLAHYDEVVVCIGELGGNVLIGLNAPFVARVDSTAADVLEARERYRVAKKAADEAQSALFPFGEYHR